MLSIQDQLSRWPEFVVKKVASNLPGLADWLRIWQPDLILVEKGQDCGNLRLEVMNLGLLIAVFDPQSGSLNLLTSHQYPISEPEDLFIVIENIQKLQAV